MEYQLYVDLDGVLSDFYKKANDLGFSNEYAATKEFWDWLNDHTLMGMKFWEDLELMPDAQELWEFVQPYHPVILSSVGGMEQAKRQKFNWLDKHFPNASAILTNSSAEKARYANPQAILIDDREKSIVPWRMAGGIGILHVNAVSTIAQLREIGGEPR